MIVPKDCDWHLLAGDSAAAPAIGRRLAELPTGARAIVIAQLDDLAPLELGSCAMQVAVQQAATGSALVEAINAMVLPPGDGYAGCAGEARAMAQVREILVADKAHPSESMRIAAYWKRGAADFHEDLVR